MRLDKSLPRSVGRVMLVLSLLLCAFQTEAASKRASAKTSTTPELFSQPEVLRIALTIPEEGMATLRKYHWDPGQPGARSFAFATVEEGGQVYTNVAVHLKGAAGSFRNVDDRPCLTLNFDRFARRQDFHGLTKLSLNNSVQDPSYVSEQLCRELYLQAGVPVPRTTHAFVQLNGRDLGLYVLAEGWNRDFLQQHFKNARGTLYDGGFLKEVTDTLSVNSGDESKDQLERTALAEAAKEPDLARRLGRLEKSLDLDRFLSLLALDVILWNWDGYAMNRNNWRLYHDPGTGRMVFMPHGLDQMFWKPEGSILPPMQGLVASAALEVPSLRQRYFDRIKQLAESLLQPEVITNRARVIAARFTPELQRRSPQAAEEQAKALGDLCEAVVRRARSLQQQLAKPIEPAHFDTAGYASLSNWESKADFGHPEFSKAAPEFTQPVLRILTAHGSSIGSWRTSLWLEKGSYRLQGTLKVSRIVGDPGDPRAGGGVRAGRTRAEGYTAGTSGWKEIDYPFTVDEPLTEVPIVCEFRGAQGEVAFQAESLRVKREAAAGR